MRVGLVVPAAPLPLLTDDEVITAGQTNIIFVIHIFCVCV
jgi:hypothetical protein